MYKYETNDAYDLDWSEEVLNKLSSKFDDDDLIDSYSIESEREGGYGSPSYRVYYIEFETKNYDGYRLKLNEEYSQWVLSCDYNEIDSYYSGLEGEAYEEEIYTVNIDINELYEWVIEKVKEHERKAGITEKADDMVETIENTDDITKEDKVKIIKYLMRQLDVSLEDLS